MHSRQTLLQTLFPKARAEIFRLLFGSKRRPRYVREIMGETNLALRSIQDELRKLSAIGLLRSRSNGYHRFFSANSQHPIFRELVRIAEQSERLPHSKSSDLFRASRFVARKKRMASRPRAMRPRHEPNWGIFSKRRLQT